MRLKGRLPKSSGEGGIRTLGRVAPTPVFETGPIGHSGTSPDRPILADTNGFAKHGERLYEFGGPGSEGGFGGGKLSVKVA